MSGQPDHQTLLSNGLGGKPPLVSTYRQQRSIMIVAMAKRSKMPDRQAREAAELQLFVQRYARKSRPCFDPNDRSYDRKVEAAAKRMKPEELDAYLRHGEDDRPIRSEE